MIRRLTTTAAFVFVFTSLASAEVIFIGDPVPLGDLLGGDPIRVGDKIFTDFTYLETGDMPLADDINVQRIRDCDGNLGLRFQGSFVDLPGGSGSDALITFKVRVAPNSPDFISDVHLAGNPDVLGGPGLASVTETFIPSVNPSLNIFDDGVTEKLTDWADLIEPVRMLQVQKDINLLAGVGSSGATLSFVDQTFSQIPEPTSLGLLCIAGLAMLGLRRRA